VAPIAKKHSAIVAKAHAYQLSVGNTVRDYRKRLKLTQGELAELAGLHRTYVADIERGARNLTLRNLVALADALNVTLTSLLDRPQHNVRDRVDASG